MGLAWLAAQHVANNIYLSLLIKVVVAAVAYIASLRLLGAQIMKECLEFALSKVRRKA